MGRKNVDNIPKSNGFDQGFQWGLPIYLDIFGWFLENPIKSCF